MKLIRCLAVMLCIAMMFIMCAFSAAASDEETAVQEAPVIGINYLESVSVGGESTGASYYVYMPDDLHDFDILSNFLNGLIFVYPDKAPDSEEDALALIQELGLDVIAGEQPASIVIPIPVNGDSWSEDDLSAYYEIQYYMAGGVISMADTGPVGEYDRHTMNSLQYVIAEGSGATFVNNVLSQHAERIAGILTFGGEMDADLPLGLALPAYLVNADDTAVEYYKAVDETDTEDGNVYTNSTYELKKVIVADGSDTFDAASVEAAWDTLLSRTMRLSVTANLVLNSQDDSEWILMDWPNLDELGITRVDHTMNDGTADRDVYDFIPESVAESDEEVPLVLVLHGGNDDPINVVSACGWAELAAEKGFVVVSPDYTFYDDEFLYDVIQYAVETYPIDTSRIYVFGFSFGGKSTVSLAFAYPDLIAAAAPFGATDNEYDTGELVMDAEKYDMPFIFMVGTNDDLSRTVGEDGINRMTVLDTGASFWENILDINEIHHDDEDFEAQQYWGFTPDEQYTIEDRGLSYEYSCYTSDEYSVPLVELVAFIGAGHANSDYQATAAWQFMSQFARGEDGSLIVLD